MITRQKTSNRGALLRVQQYQYLYHIFRMYPTVQQPSSITSKGRKLQYQETIQTIELQTDKEVCKIHWNQIISHYSRYACYQLTLQQLSFQSMDFFSRTITAIAYLLKMFSNIALGSHVATGKKLIMLCRFCLQIKRVIRETIPI